MRIVYCSRQELSVLWNERVVSDAVESGLLRVKGEFGGGEISIVPTSEWNPVHLLSGPVEVGGKG